ncbi:4-hydroxyphenylpyruvate dioxygenase [Dickeya chrysanthemi Ech1591]|uniref:4-hydroxyphenylpyruvate dioxygenase n=1 Tax=Dickeya chrysanthemi (strain Ech1591) TaxID=561229 RepID=C6CR10_DICC1|nr:4-hydroxyphenylpyruvate dioxygenase [Dickeya chrysanthemi]ACT09027.1 4-hydroxyphenylpyruvate dioxygenase [Dickeya chrysanthemi Ech1591]
MTELVINPLDLNGFAFVEFVTDTPETLSTLFVSLGFTCVAHHRHRDIALFRQNNINFLVNNTTTGFPQTFLQEHGAGACGVGFYVKDAHRAYERALQSGAKPVDQTVNPGEIRVPAIEGIGGSRIYFIEKYHTDIDIFDIDFSFIPGVERNPQGFGLHTIDHLTNNVYQGRMDYWSEFYTRIFNFRQIRYFDIAGEYTGLHSKAMEAPDGKIRIPLNEEAEGSNGQIQEFLRRFNGEGIQHIAMQTDDILTSIDQLRQAGLPLMTAPSETYYRMVEERLPGHGRDTAALRARGILIDGNTRNGQKKLLLQIFSETMIGPLFFEFIERDGDEGFGEGNFKALFESMERDQLARGEIKVTTEAV